MATRYFLSIVILGLLASPVARGGERGLLVVAPKGEWIAAIDSLLELRRSQGWQVSSVLVQRPNTHTVVTAIKEASAGQPHITHVLLLGHDRSLPMARRPNLQVQTFDTDWHLYSDDPYGLPGSDGIPTLAVGRLPFDGVHSLRAIAEKTVRYEAERGAFAPQALLIVGRTPAPLKEVLGVSPQDLADGMAKRVLAGFLARIKRLDLRVRTAFDGSGFFHFSEAPQMLVEELNRRPWIWAYAGHASHAGFTTYHSHLAPDSILASDILDASLRLRQVSGPLFSAGCHMGSPVAKTLPLARALLILEGGPPAAALFTGVNEDYWVAQWFETLLLRLDTIQASTTIGELVLRTKRGMSKAPQSGLSKLVERFMGTMYQLNSTVAADYGAVVLRNNEMLTVWGDPCLTIGFPTE